MVVATLVLSVYAGLIGTGIVLMAVLLNGMIPEMAEEALFIIGTLVTTVGIVVFISMPLLYILFWPEENPFPIVFAWSSCWALGLWLMRDQLPPPFGQKTTDKPLVG